MVRPLTRPALAGLLLAGLAAACGGGGGGAGAAGHNGAPTTAAPTTSTTASPAGLSYLVAWGATLVSWNDNHTIDPNRARSYWPLLPDDRDTYTHLSDPAGRVVGYVLALDPSVSAADALTRLANDLPLDSRVVQDKTLAGCAQVVETSPTIDAIAPGGILAELTSLSGPYQPSAVATITVSPLGTNQSLPGHC
ncbi:MAG TPA: hypothetical protein VNF50_09720 [Acidimicrobiales bacterium]|nr:hypothetical protein [Acidimicrobiales bacterium]